MGGGGLEKRGKGNSERKIGVATHIQSYKTTATFLLLPQDQSHAQITEKFKFGQRIYYHDPRNRNGIVLP